MAWKVVTSHPDCPTDSPVAVVNTDDDSVEGCYADEDTANAHIDDLNSGAAKPSAPPPPAGNASLLGEVFAEEPTPPVDPVLEATYGVHALPIEAYSQGYWEGTLTIEGSPSGDGREFEPGALVWRDLPLTMYWQMATAPEHDNAVAVARVDEITRNGANITAKGQFDMAGANGVEAHRLVHGGFLRGQSVTLDELTQNDVELIFPEPDPNADEDPFAELFMEPEKVIFHAGRIMDTVLTGQPAFQEAYITLVPDDQMAGATPDEPTNDDSGALQPASSGGFRAVPPHHFAVVDTPWNLDTAHACLPANMTPEFASLAFAWIDRDEVYEGLMTRDDAKLLHHTITPAGMPGSANLTAVLSCIGRLNGAAGGVEIPEADRRAVYEHLAQHVRDAGQTAPPLVTIDEMHSLRALTASLSMVVDPPVKWLGDPHFKQATPLTVTDDGEVFSHLALWNTCHTSFANQCVVPPREEEFAYFTTGELLARDGSRWPVGKLTFGTNHAPGHLTAMPAIEHYENTGFVAADVTCGADKFGIWVHGAIRPGLTDTQVRAIRASAISGDWRRIGGRMRLVGGLLVNVPGFPIPRTRTYVHDGAQTALVASGIVRTTKPRVKSAVAHRIAATIGRDPASRRAALRARIHGK